MPWVGLLVVFVVGCCVGAGLTALWYERNNAKATRRKLEPSISTLDVFELPESMRPPEYRSKPSKPPGST